MATADATLRPSTCGAFGRPLPGWTERAARPARPAARGLAACSRRTRSRGDGGRAGRMRMAFVPYPLGRRSSRLALLLALLAGGLGGAAAQAPVQVALDGPAAANSPPALGGAAAAVPPGVTGGTVCTSRGPSGACLAYSAANGAVGMVCSEQTAEGECAAWAQSYTVSTACAQYGAGGQCLAFGTSPAANPPPGGAAQTTALCLEYNAVGQCNRYSAQPVPDPTTIQLTAQA